MQRLAIIKSRDTDMNLNDRFTCCISKFPYHAILDNHSSIGTQPTKKPLRAEFNGCEVWTHLIQGYNITAPTKIKDWEKFQLQQSIFATIKMTKSKNENLSITIKPVPCCLCYKRKKNCKIKNAQESKSYIWKLWKSLTTNFLIWTKFSKTVQGFIPNQHFTIKNTPKQSHEEMLNLKT